MKTLRTAFCLVCLLLVIASPSLAETPDEIYAFGEHLKNDGLFDAAAAQFLRFARENPRDIRAPQALLNGAECLVEAGDVGRAVTVLEAIDSTYPDHTSQCRVKVQLGRLYSRLERYAEADRAFTDVIVTMSDCDLLPEALLGKGEVLISMQNYRSALDAFDDILENHLESRVASRAAYNRAFCLQRLERDDLALSAYERIVTRFPGDPLAGFAALEAARMHAADGDADRAIEYYTKAKAFETKVFFQPASIEGADLLEKRGDHGRALLWYEELLTREDVDDRSTVYVNAVRAAYNDDDYAAVRRLVQEHRTRYPKTFAPPIAYLYARTALATNDFDLALDEANKLEAVAPGTEWGRSGARIRGEAFLGMGRVEEGVDELDRFVSIAADSTARCEVLRSISEVSFTVTRDTTRALDALVELLAVQRRQFPSEILSVARTHEAASRTGEAADLYADLIGRYPLSSEAERAEERLEYLERFTVTDYKAAARALDQRLYRLATQPGAGGLLSVAEARIEVLKDFEGALEVCRQLEKTSRGTDAYPRVLYLAGLAHAQMARRNAEAGRDDRARDEMNEALDRWNELISKHGGDPLAARASFDRVVLRGDVEGRMDAAAAQQVLDRYPNDPAGAALNERVGDYYAELDGEDNLKRAAAAYSRALQIDNTDGDVWFKLASVQARQQNYDGALKTFERLSRENNRVALKAAYEAGKVLRRLERYREAVPKFDRVAAADANGSFGGSAALQAADCLYLQNQFDAALDRYARVERMARSDQRRWEVSYRAALCLKHLGRYREAMDRLESALESEAGGTLRTRAYLDAAEVAASLGDDGRRVSFLEAYVNEAGVESDESRAAGKRLVRAYLSAARPDDARKLAERLARTAPDGDHEPRALLAMAMYRQGRTGEAKKVADDVAAKAGADAPYVREIGVEAARYHYDRQAFGDAAAAIQPFAENCSGTGVCEDARYLYAMSLLAGKDLERGTSAAQRFFRDYPVSQKAPKLHLRLGNVLAEAGRTTESLLHYDEAAETATDSTIAFMSLKNLAVSQQRLKRWRDAEKTWQRVLTRFNSNEFTSEAALNVARCKMEYGNYDGAIAAYQEVLPVLDSESKAWAFYWIGQSYEQVGNLQAAVVEYLKVPYLAGAGGMLIPTAQLKAAECYRKIDRPNAARELYSKVLNAQGAASNWGKVAQKAIEELDAGSASNPGGGQ